MEQVLLPVAAMFGVTAGGIVFVLAAIGGFDRVMDWRKRRRSKRSAEDTNEVWSLERLKTIEDAIKENTGVLRESMALAERSLTLAQELENAHQSRHEEIVKVLSPMLDNSGKSTTAVERIRDQFKVMGKAMGIDPQKDYAQFIHDNAEEDSQDMVNEMVIEEMRTQGIPYKAALSNVKARLAYRSNGR